MDSSFPFFVGAGGPRPKPTRDELCAVKNRFQGLTVQTQQYGELPLFDPVIGWFTGDTAAADRRSCYAVHKAAGDTHINLTVSGQYRGTDPRNAYSSIPGADYAYDKDGLRALVSEVIQNGFMVLLMFAGDGESVNDNPQPGEYNDPNGWTYGQRWLMLNFPRLWSWLKEGTDLTPWILPVPGYDGVVPDWQPPSQVDDFLLMAREIVGPDHPIGLELSAGYCVWAGNEADNYPTPAGQALDVILQEFPYPMAPPEPPPANFLELSNTQRAPWDQVWQMVGRLANPYIRPLDQPAADDPNPPFLLEPGTPRGPFVYIAWEFSTYGWVRGCPTEQVEVQREYLYSLGCTYVG